MSMLHERNQRSDPATLAPDSAAVLLELFNDSGLVRAFEIQKFAVVEGHFGELGNRLF